MSFSQKQTAAAAAKLLQSCPTLCDPINGSPPGSPVPGILQARTLEWAAISFSNACMHVKLLQSCPTLCDPIEGSPPGSSIQGIIKARILEWGAIAFSSSLERHVARERQGQDLNPCWFDSQVLQLLKQFSNKKSPPRTTLLISPGNSKGAARAQ